MTWFADLSPIYQAVLATMGTWGLTAAGAGVVVFFRTVPQRVLDAMLGFAGGFCVMMVLDVALG